MPKVSVLMAVWNYPNVGTVFCDLDDQTFQDFDVVVVDDASDDGETWNTYRLWWPNPRYKFLYMMRPCGLTYCLSVGLASCEGEYVARHDADDISFERRLERQVAFLDSHPSVVAVGTRVAYIDEEGKFLRVQYPWSTWFPTLQLYIGRNCFVHGSLLIRRDALEKVGAYREVFDCSQDVDLLLRLAKVGKLVILPDVLYCVRRHPEQVSQKHRGQQKAWAVAARWASL